MQKSAASRALPWRHVMRAVVVSYNSRATLARCLASLGSTPVTVVDNASQDGSAELVERDFAGVRLLRSERNLGFGAACNLAVQDDREASREPAQAYFFLNPDAWIETGSLAVLTQRLAEEPRLGALAPRLRYPDGRPQFAWSTDRGLLGESLQKLRNPFEAHAWNHAGFPRLWRRWVGPGWLSGAALCVRAQAFAAVGGFDEGFFLYFEDADLCLRLRAAGYALGLEPGLEVVHLRGASGAAREHYRASQRRYYAKHRPAWEGRLLAWIVGERPR